MHFHQRSRTRRGLMLFTSLFVVLCLYAVCSVIFASSQQDLRMQVFSEQKTRADLLAQAALSRCLREANETPGWASSHTVAAGTNPSTTPGLATSFQIDPTAPVGHYWLEATTDLNLVIARGSCRLGGDTSVSSAHCLRRPQSEGRLYVNQENPGHLPQTYLLKRSGAPAWEPLPPVPAFFWRQAGAGPALPAVLRNSPPPDAGPPRFAQYAHAPAADDVGNFYQALYLLPGELAAEPDAFRLDYVVRCPANSSPQWEVLPPLPLPGYVNQSAGPPTLVASSPTDTDRRIYLSAANQAQLVVGQRSEATGVATLYRLSDPVDQGATYDVAGDTLTPLAGTATWSVLPYCPAADWSSAGSLTVTADRAAAEMRNLTMDRQGNLYGRLDKPAGQRDVLVYFRNATGQWSYLPAPPAFAYEMDSSARWILNRLGSPPDRFADTAVDPEGNFYCVWRRSGLEIDSVFKFCPSGVPPSAGGMVDGTWKVLPAAPRSHYNLAGGLVQNPGASCPQFTSMSIDANGCLYMKCSPFISFLGLALDNVIYSWDCSSGGEKIDQVLPAIPQSVTDPDYSAAPYYQQTTSGFVASGSQQMAGGGLQSSGSDRFVPLSYFSQ